MQLKKPAKIPNSKEWKKIMQENYEFIYIENIDEIPEHALWTTSCSKTKTKYKQGHPTDFYLGRFNLLFYKYMDKFNFKYGVLSDKYGIHMYDECLDYYDIHPTNLDNNDKFFLGRTIKKKVKKYGYKKIVFYFPSPLQSKPYFEILWYSELPVYYISKIKILD